MEPATPESDNRLQANRLHWEMLERYEVLSHAGVEKGTKVLDIETPIADAHQARELVALVDGHLPGSGG